MLRKLMYWMRTGDTKPSVPNYSLPEVDTPPEESDKELWPYSAEVREDLVYNAWQWRILKKGKREFSTPYGIEDSGYESTRKGAISAAKKEIKKLQLHDKNSEQRWESV